MDMVATELAADKAQISRFVNTLFKHTVKGTGWISMRAAPHSRGVVWTRDHKLADGIVSAAAAFATEIAAADDPTRVFSPPVCVFGDERNASGNILGGERNVLSCPVIAAEWDTRPSAGLQMASGLLGRPTLVVRSGGVWRGPDGDEDKLHAYWRLTTPAVGDDLLKLKHARSLLAALTGGDSTAAPASHPLRWPGSWHTKGAPRLAAIDDSLGNGEDIDLTGALNALLAEATARGLDTKAPRKPGDGTGLKDATPTDGEKLKRLAGIMDNSGPKDWERWNRIGMAFFGASHGSPEGYEAWRYWSAKNEDHDDASCEDRWDHFFTSPPTDLGVGTLYQEASKVAGDMTKALVMLDDLPNTPPPEGATPRRKLILLDSDEAADTALDGLAAPLIKGLLDQGAMSVLYGDSNVGKTFVAMDIGWHIAQERPYAGRKTTGGLVLYIAAEGGLAAKRRVRALREKYGSAKGRFKLLVSPVNLRDPNADIGPLLDLIAAMPEKPLLIVVDTLSRAMAGGDENSSVDMGALVVGLDNIRAATKAHLMVVHHTGKDAARGARGWSGLRAATDTELEVAAGRLSATKQRDLEGTWETGFSLEVKTLGLDADGDPITSCTVRLGDVAAVRVGVASSAEQDVLDAIKIIKATSPKGGEKGVSVAEMIRYFADNLSLTMDGNAIRARLSKLATKKLVVNTTRGFWDFPDQPSQRDETETQDAESGCFA